MIIHDFRVSIWFSLLFAAGFSACAFALSGLFVAIIIFILAFAGSYATLQIAYPYRREKDALQQQANIVACIGLLLFGLAIIALNLYTALFTLVFFLQLALNLVFREHRQVYFSVMITFVALLGGATLGRHGGLLFFFVLYIVFAAFYLSAVYTDKHTPEYQKKSVGNIQWRHYLGLSALIACVSLFIYLLIPRLPAAHIGGIAIAGWGKYADGRQSFLPEETDLTQLLPKISALENNNVNGDISSTGQQAVKRGKDTVVNAENLQDERIYLYVKSPRPSYLKQQVRSYFDGHSWHVVSPFFKAMQPEHGEFVLYGNNHTTEVIEITTAIDLPTADIFTTATTTGLIFPAQSIGRNIYDMLKATQPLTKETTYQINQSTEYLHGRLIDREQTPVNAFDTQLPKLSKRIAELAEKAIGNAQSDWQKAVALEHFLRSNYQYSLATIESQNNIPLTQFLFATRYGHCEYFATALAVMLRTQGIPARLVVGFAAQDYNPMTGYYEVKGINAHAWVEAFVDGVWITLEATPLYSAEQPSEDAGITMTKEELKSYLDKLKQQREKLPQKPPSFKDIMLMFWYAVLIAVDWLWSLLKWLVWYCGWVILLAAIGYSVFKRYQDNLTDYIEKYQVKHYRPKQQLADIAFYLGKIQTLLARHQYIERAPGETIETFTEALIQRSLLTDKQDIIKIRQLINQ